MTDLPPRRGYERRRAALLPDADQPENLEGLIASGTGEFEDEPIKRSAIRFVVTVAVFVVIAVLVVSIPVRGIIAWYEPLWLVCGLFDEDGSMCSQIFYWPG